MACDSGGINRGLPMLLTEPVRPGKLCQCLCRSFWEGCRVPRLIVFLSPDIVELRDQLEAADYRVVDTRI